MKKLSKYNWLNYRNKWVWYGSKKIKLRAYMQMNAYIMKSINKPAWVGVDHYNNYKICVCKYGLPGLKIYEERFYKNRKMPYNCSFSDKFLYWLEDKIQNFKRKF